MIDFKKIPDSDKPRERLYLYGSDSLSNEELISIILKTGTKDKSVKDLSIMLLSKFKDIRNLRDLEINNITEIKGIGSVKAIELILKFGACIMALVTLLLCIMGNVEVEILIALLSVKTVFS